MICVVPALNSEAISKVKRKLNGLFPIRAAKLLNTQSSAVRDFEDGVNVFAGPLGKLLTLSIYLTSQQTRFAVNQLRATTLQNILLR